ncbi:MAG TPA: YkgJ family cysteine cluster protein [Candidatus Acidoferrum sp.]|nr:YkgJ family cysteine cluster protein [Candidatus Acidoferrum sp.]
MSEANKGTTYSFDVCCQCKSICCHDAKPPLTGNRKKILKKYLKGQKINIKKPFAKEDYSYPDVDELVFCKLFNKQTGKCSVHPVKPETCVAGPVTFDINFSTKRVEWFLKKSELCGFAGILYSDKAAFKQHLAAAKKELTELICQLEADELKAIVKIEEPQTFKVGEDDLPLEVKKKLGLT